MNKRQMYENGKTMATMLDHRSTDCLDRDYKWQMLESTAKLEFSYYSIIIVCILNFKTKVYFYCLKNSLLRLYCTRCSTGVVTFKMTL